MLSPTAQIASMQTTVYKVLAAPEVQPSHKHKELK